MNTINLTKGIDLHKYTGREVKLKINLAKGLDLYKYNGGVAA